MHEKSLVSRMANQDRETEIVKERERKKLNVYQSSNFSTDFLGSA